MQTTKTFLLVAWELMGGASRRVAEDARRRPVFYSGLGISLAFHALILMAFAGWTVAQTPVSRGSFRDAEAPLNRVDAEPEAAVNELEALDPTAQEEENVFEAGGGGGAAASLPGSNLTAGPAFAALSALPPSCDSSSMVSSMMGAFSGGGGLGSGGGSGSGRAGKVSGKTGKLFGRVIQSGNEGVVVLLDVSGSMSEASGKVRAMVEREFSEALVIELSGALFADQKTLSRLRRERGPNDYYLTYYTSMLPKSVVPVVTDLLNSRPSPPESVYFLSDYNDYVDSSAVRDLEKLMAFKGVKFFAHSLGKEPDSVIKGMCRRTGGDVLRESVE